MKKRLFALAFIFTLLLFLSLLLLGELLAEKRVTYVNENFQQLNTDLNELQTFSLMSEVYGPELACIASQKKLLDLGEDLWDLGIKLDQYRSASEEFTKDPYYLDQKKIFNERQLIYLMLLTKLRNECDSNQNIISFFYRNSDDCKKCDDQSFVLTDIKEETGNNVAIFSFDMDLNITSIDVLGQYYNLTEYPCIVVDDITYCGIRGKDEVMDLVCDGRENADFCS